MVSPDYFPVGTRVVLGGLVKAPDLNGKSGVVKSGLANGRQHVFIEDVSKSVALKVSNLKYEGRSVDSLSVKELKTILQSKASASDVELSGADKSELQSKVSALTDASPESVAQWLAEAKPKAPASTTTPSTNATVDPSQAADQLSNMNPEQLRQQAQMMRSMPPDSIRRMNPQLAQMTDAQIQQAATQMEMMASNPTMMKAATDQIKNMSPEEIQRMQAQAMGEGGLPASSSGSGNSSTNASAMPSVPSANQATQAANMMANMTPEQLKQQADMFESMSPDSLRSSNSQLEHMTDDQIKMAATQFRMMADNPEMMKMAMDQMKNLTPEQMEDIKKGGANGGPPDPSMMMGGDPSKILANMDKNQLKKMLQSLKENPEMLKQFAGQSGMNQEQLAKGIEMFGDMDEAKLDMALGWMQRVQKAKDVWTQVDTKTGGNLVKILALVSFLVVGLLVRWLFFRSGASAADVVDSVTVDDIPNMAKEQAVAEDEFASEF